MHTPLNFNRPFSEMVLRDWWEWQQHQTAVVVPEIWLCQQNSPDLWFHMFYTAHASCPSFVDRLVDNCVAKQRWTFHQMTSTLLDWQRYRNIFSNPLFMHNVMNAFSTRHSSFTRAVLLCCLMVPPDNTGHCAVLDTALELSQDHCYTHTPLSEDALVWEAVWSYWRTVDHRHTSEEFVQKMSRHFSLHDFLVLATPQQPLFGRLEEGKLRAFKVQHGLYSTSDIFLEGDDSVLHALGWLVKSWPNARVEDSEVAYVRQLLERVVARGKGLEHAQAIDAWVSRHGIVAALDEGAEDGDNTKGCRKM